LFNFNDAFLLTALYEVTHINMATSRRHFVNSPDSTTAFCTEIKDLV